MPEYRTKVLNRELLLFELSEVSVELQIENVQEVAISFGWDSNLSIDEMWKRKNIPTIDILKFITASEKDGVVVVGKSDIFIETYSFLFVLGHEGDAQVKGDSDLVLKFKERWTSLAYSPYEVGQNL